MRRLFRKRGGGGVPVEELELQTGTARVEEVIMDQQKGETEMDIMILELGNWYKKSERRLPLNMMIWTFKRRMTTTPGMMSITYL